MKRTTNETERPVDRTAMVIGVAELMKRFGVCDDVIMAWIDSGELKAMNVGSKKNGKRPTYHTCEEWVEEFKMSRTVVQQSAVKVSRSKFRNVKSYV